MHRHQVLCWFVNGPIPQAVAEELVLALGEALPYSSISCMSSGLVPPGESALASTDLLVCFDYVARDRAAPLGSDKRAFLQSFASSKRHILGLGQGAVALCEALGGSTISNEEGDSKDQVTFSFARASPGGMMGLLERHVAVILTGSIETLPLGFTWQQPGLVFSNDTGIVGCLGLPHVSPLSFLEVHLPLLDDARMFASEAQLRAALQSAQVASEAQESTTSLLANLLPTDTHIIAILEEKCASLQAENAKLRETIAALSLRSNFDNLPLENTIVPVPSFRDGSDFVNLMRTQPLTCGLVLGDRTVVSGSTGKRVCISTAAVSLETVWSDTMSIAEEVSLPAVPLCLCALDNDRFIAGLMDGSLHVVSGGGLIATWKHSKHVNGICFTGSHLVSVSRDASMLITSPHTWLVERKLIFPATPECCACVGDDIVAVSVRGDYRLHLVDVGSITMQTRMLSLNVVAEDDHCSFTVLAMAEHGGRLLCVTDKNLVLLLDVFTGKRRDYSGLVCGDYSRPCLAWAPDGKFFACSSEPNCVCVWDTISGEHVLLRASHKGAVRALCFVGEGQILSWGMDGVVGMCSFLL